MRIRLVLVRILIPPRAMACLLLGVWLPLATAVGDPIVMNARPLSETFVSRYSLTVLDIDLAKFGPQTMCLVGMLQVPLVIYPVPLARVTFPRERGPVGTELPRNVLMKLLSRGISVLLLLWNRPLMTGAWKFSLLVAVRRDGIRLLLFLYRPTSGKAGTLRPLRCRMRNGQC